MTDSKSRISHRATSEPQPIIDRLVWHGRSSASKQAREQYPPLFYFLIFPFTLPPKPNICLSIAREYIYHSLSLPFFSHPRPPFLRLCVFLFSLCVCVFVFSCVYLSCVCLFVCVFFFFVFLSFVCVVVVFRVGFCQPRRD